MHLSPPISLISASYIFCSERKVSWVRSYCSKPENLFYCEVSKSYIQDNFNLYDLKSEFESDSQYKEALAILLDETSIRKSSCDNTCGNAEHLYGLIHARYIKSPAGLEMMRRKYVAGHFGVCPRHFIHIHHM